MEVGPDSEKNQRIRAIKITPIVLGFFQENLSLYEDMCQRLNRLFDRIDKIGRGNHVLAVLKWISEYERLNLKSLLYSMYFNTYSLSRILQTQNRRQD